MKSGVILRDETIQRITKAKFLGIIFVHQQEQQLTTSEFAENFQIMWHIITNLKLFGYSILKTLLLFS